MPTYRKKPVEIEARELLNPRAMPEHHAEFVSVASWCGADVVDDAVDGPCLIIHTLEGDHKALPGDYIIKGVKGEFYPCKPDIFAATYDRVSN